jgi:hypothetical protein
MAYDDIKNRLVTSHQLTNFQKAEKLFQMPVVGSRKMSDLMAAMLETCPRGEEKSSLFFCIFLQRLTREIWVLLATVDHKVPKTLTTRVDDIWTLPDNPGSGSSTVTMLQPDGQEVDFVIAVRSGSQRGGNSHGGTFAVGAGVTAAAERPEVGVPPTSQRLPSRPGWPLACALSIGNTTMRLRPATPLQLAGKWRCLGQLNAVAAGEILNLLDELFGRWFLADTGTSYSIFPHQSSQPVSGPVLKGPGRQTIPCWGEKQLPVQFSGRRFTWTFLLAKVKFPILGADFLKHFNLIVDPAASHLLATDTL